MLPCSGKYIKLDLKNTWDCVGKNLTIYCFVSYKITLRFFFSAPLSFQQKNGVVGLFFWFFGFFCCLEKLAFLSLKWRFSLG